MIEIDSSEQEAQTRGDRVAQLCQARAWDETGYLSKDLVLSQITPRI